MVRQQHGNLKTSPVPDLFAWAALEMTGGAYACGVVDALIRWRTHSQLNLSHLPPARGLGLTSKPPCHSPRFPNVSSMTSWFAKR